MIRVTSSIVWLVFWAVITIPFAGSVVAIPVQMFTNRTSAVWLTIGVLVELICVAQVTYVVPYLLGSTRRLIVTGYLNPPQESSPGRDWARIWHELRTDYALEREKRRTRDNPPSSWDPGPPRL
jgi:hypothetical protein